MSTAKDSSLFPKLSSEAIAKLRPLGRTREALADDIVVRQGEPLEDLIVVESGEITVEVRSHTGVSRITEHGPGEFFGDVHLLSGRASVVTARMSQGGQLLFVPRSELKQLMASDTELGEALLRAFILRRIELLARGQADAVVVGSTNSVGTLRIREFLTRNGYPYSFLDLERDSDVQQTMDAFNLKTEDIPVLILHGQGFCGTRATPTLPHILG